MFLYYILKDKKLQLLNLKQAQFIKNLNQKKLDLKYVKKTNRCFNRSTFPSRGELQSLSTPTKEILRML